MINMDCRKWFIYNVCPYETKWFCDGKHVPDIAIDKYNKSTDISNAKDREPCEFFKNGCKHPKKGIKRKAADK